MQLDAITLFIANVAINLVIGSLFLFSWRNSRANRELLLMGLCFYSATAGVLLSGVPFKGFVSESRIIGHTLLFLAYGGVWQAMRLFGRHSARVLAGGAGAAAWFALIWFVPDAYFETARTVSVAVIPGIYVFLSVAELWHGRHEKLPSRMPLCVVMLVNNILAIIRAVLVLADTSLIWNAEEGWVGVLTLVIVIMNVAVSYLVLSLIKERLELEQAAQTMVDPLTGLGNRRALGVYAGRALRRQAVAGGPICVAVLDLDHFKQINDTYGHFIGDDVLRIFAERATMKLRPNDYLFRIGGEEFLCMLPTAHEKDAVKVMERISRSLSTYTLGEGENARQVTLSAGVASSERVGYDLEELTRAADRALYEAKRAGRNCVRIYMPAPVDTTAGDGDALRMQS